jgi:hypothetical protein
MAIVKSDAAGASGHTRLYCWRCDDMQNTLHAIASADSLNLVRVWAFGRYASALSNDGRLFVWDQQEITADRLFKLEPPTEVFVPADSGNKRWIDVAQGWDFRFALAE